MHTHAIAPPLPAPVPDRAAPAFALAPPREPDRRQRRLAEGLRARDPRALEEIYALHGATAFGYLVRTLRDRDAAEDVQQQVFTEVWHRGPQYDPARAGLLTWVMTIARSRAIDHLRRRVPEPRDPHDATERAGEVAPGADALLDGWRMSHYLALLPDDERRLLQLRFYEELSQTEIAERTGIALGTIKARMVRGLRRLRELIEAEEGVPA